MSVIPRILLPLLAATCTACIVHQENPLNNLASARAGQPPALMKLSSPAFAPNAPIPDRHSAYSVNVSPPLEWSGHPGTTRTFAIVMEDPDAKLTQPEPFVHRVEFNIPAVTTSLPAMVPGTAQLPRPRSRDRHAGGNTRPTQPRRP